MLEFFILGDPQGLHSPAIRQVVREMGGNRQTKTGKRYAWINEQLGKHPYLLGDSFSVADAYLFALTGWGQAPWLTSYYKADIHFDTLNNLRAWYERVRERPAVQKALQEEGLV